MPECNIFAYALCIVFLDRGKMKMERQIKK
jgi:hypothetical protein